MFDIAVQKVILQALKSNPSIAQKISSRIYDFIPQNAAFPYVSIGEDSLIEDDVSVYDGASVLVTINTWSKSKGRKECKEIQGAIRDTLHKSNLTASGYVVDFCHWQRSESFIDSDGETRHGVCTYFLKIREA